MTNTALKTQIDTQITNETVKSGITPTEVGNNIKAVVDYADQQDATKQTTLVSGTNIKTINGTSLLGSGNITVSGSSVIKIQKTTITTAQVLSLFTTPITILDSSEIGIIKIPFSFYIKRNIGNLYVTTSSFKIVADSLSTIATLNSSIMNNNTNGFVQVSGTVQVNSSSQEKVNLYKIKLDSDPTGGTGDLDVYVTYIEITL